IWWRGAPHTAKERSQGSTCVSWGAPLPPYIKEQGGGRPALEGRAKGGGVLLPVGVGLPFPSPTWIGEGGRKGEGEGEGKGAVPPVGSKVGLEGGVIRLLDNIKN